MTNAAEVNDDFTDGLMSDFLDESTGLVSRLNENLLQLDQWTKSHAAEGERPTDLLNEMFRSAHSIKGLSGMLRLSDINVLTHKVENVFDAARNGELNAIVTLNPRAIDDARAIDARLAAGDTVGPLAGVPTERPPTTPS